LRWTIDQRRVVKGGDDRSFVTREGRGCRYGDLRRFTLKVTREVCGRGYSFHCLRHTAAVRVYRRTRDVLAVQRLLGHRSLQWTQSYLASLVVVDVGGPIAFAGGGLPAGLRVYDPDGKCRSLVGSVSVKAVAARGKAGGASDGVALEVDRRAEKKGSGSSSGSSGVGGSGWVTLDHCCLAKVMAVRCVVAGRRRVMCRRCGSLWEGDQGTTDLSAFVMVGGPTTEVGGSELPGKRPRPKKLRELAEAAKPLLCEHRRFVERPSRVRPGGVALFCADCGRYYGEKMH